MDALHEEDVCRAPAGAHSWHWRAVGARRSPLVQIFSRSDSTGSHCCSELFAKAYRDVVRLVVAELANRPYAKPELWLLS